MTSYYVTFVNDMTRALQVFNCLHFAKVKQKFVKVSLQILRRYIQLQCNRYIFTFVLLVAKIGTAVLL